MWRMSKQKTSYWYEVSYRNGELDRQHFTSESRAQLALQPHQLTSLAVPG